MPILFSVFFRTSDSDKDKFARRALLHAGRFVACGLGKIYRSDDGRNGGGTCAENAHGGELGKRLLYSGKVKMGHSSERRSFTRRNRMTTATLRDDIGWEYGEIGGDIDGALFKSEIVYISYSERGGWYDCSDKIGLCLRGNNRRQGDVCSRCRNSPDCYC